jgi:hypothetical protein
MRAGNVALLNAPGNGIADDKAIYSYMPEIVRFYSGGEAKLPNVETYRCREPQALKYVLDNLEELVVKLVDGSGGYGMLVGPTATKAQIEDFRAALIAEPHRYIAQPTLALSTVPTLTESGLAPRHVDFRPFVLTGATACRSCRAGSPAWRSKGSLVVNSSQGGGTKDSFDPAMSAATQSQSQSRARAGRHADALPHRGGALLARPLCRARRIHRPAWSRRRCASMRCRRGRPGEAAWRARCSSPIPTRLRQDRQPITQAMSRAS